MSGTRATRRLPNLLLRLFALFAVLLGLQAVPAHDNTAHAATPFKVIAFYDGTYDAAHISFDHEANQWFPAHAAENGFSYTSTTDWSQLNTANLANYQVVLFLDDYPQTASQRSAFQTYMNNGGGWMGFHVSAYNDATPSDWDWYHNTFLGTGTFQTNSWGPTAETLKIEDPNHPSMAGLPSTITSSVSEWYSWQKDLRQNPAIDILASMDQSTFPIGTDPNQTWYSGYYPIIWTNRNYKMLYANFGHNAMDYATNTTLSSTFGSSQQNQFLINGLRWLGGATSTPTNDFSVGVSPAAGSVAPGATATATVSTAITAGAAQSVALTATGAPAGATVSFSPASVTAGASSTLTVTTTSAVAPGTYPITVKGTGTTGSHTATYSLTVTGTGGGTSKTGPVTGYGGKCVDVAGAASANGTAVQLYDCNGTTAQSWTVGTDGTLKALGKCLDVTAAGTANGTKVQLYDCNGTAAQQWTPGAGNRLTNAGSGRCLDATGPSSGNGTRLQIWDCSGGANQQWVLPS